MQVIGYAKAGKEFEVRDALRAEGIGAEVPRNVRAVSRGKKRRAELITEPYLPNYVFIEVDVQDYVKMTGVKGLSATLQIVPACYKGQLPRWCELIDREAAQMEARHAQGEEVAQYVAGQRLTVTSGPLMTWLEGQRVTFTEIVERDHMQHPTIIAEVDVMGQSTRIELDPLVVKAAE